MLTFVEYCLSRHFDVDLWWDRQDTLDQAKERFHLNLEGLKLQKEMYRLQHEKASKLNIFNKWLKQLQYDLIFWLSDGSIPLLAGKQNWLHFQVPFQINGTNISTQYKLSKISQVVCNSKFTKQFIDRSFGISSSVLYPPVDVQQFMTAPLPKENIILSVGRFDQIMNAKRQDVMIEVFKTMCDQGLKSWRLVLTGGLQHNRDQFNSLNKLIGDYPIDLIHNISWDNLLDLYKRARLYWHAAGFGIDEIQEPQKVEHFGMSVVEAMAAGCIPVVCRAGGVTEIIVDTKNGFLWRTKDELVKVSNKVINDTEKNRLEMIKAAQKRALDFSKERFFIELDRMI